MLSKTQITGQKAEQYACEYLIKQGLKIVKQNYRCKMGEIDLIMRDRNYLVFVEVRARKRTTYSHGLESIHSIKQSRIIRTASFYLQQYSLTDKAPCRFDVVAITLNATQPTLQWIKDAFRL